MTETDARGDEQPLYEHLPNRILDADALDWEAFAAEVGTTTAFYTLPTTPDGAEEDWLDKLALSQHAARYVRDGGEIDVERVIVDE